MNHARVTRCAPSRSAFTLIELLVVIAILAILIAILMPAIGNARRAGKSAVCLANLRTIGQATMTYVTENDNYVIPSYNMTGVTGVGVSLDGWGPILDREGYMPGNRSLHNGPFTCPEAMDISGVGSGQTGTNPDNPRGWMEWPTTRTTAGFVPTTIPEKNFLHIMRVAYWINGDNPIGAVASVTPDLYYTGSVGYGPSTEGIKIRPTRFTAFKFPERLVVAADGLYAGRQRDNRYGSTNCRIGYRHPTGNGRANTLFADGHANSIAGEEFPRASGGTNPLKLVQEENRITGPTVYADPIKALNLDDRQ